MLWRSRLSVSSMKVLSLLHISTSQLMAQLGFFWSHLPISLTMENTSHCTLDLIHLSLLIHRHLQDFMTVACYLWFLWWWRLGWIMTNFISDQGHFGHVQFGHHFLYLLKRMHVWWLTHSQKWFVGFPHVFSVITQVMSETYSVKERRRNRKESPETVT